jgi:hypothetical protein
VRLLNGRCDTALGLRDVLRGKLGTVSALAAFVLERARRAGVEATVAQAALTRGSSAGEAEAGRALRSVSSALALSQLRGGSAPLVLRAHSLPVHAHAPSPLGPSGISLAVSPPRLLTADAGDHLSNLPSLEPGSEGTRLGWFAHHAASPRPHTSPPPTPAARAYVAAGGVRMCPPSLQQWSVLQTVLSTTELTGEPTYGYVVPTRLRGPLDAEALLDALKALVRRHAPLALTLTLALQ